MFPGSLSRTEAGPKRGRRAYDPVDERSRRTEIHAPVRRSIVLVVSRLEAALLPIVGLALTARPERPELRADPLLLDDPAVLAELEDRGLSFARVVGPRRLAQLTEVVEHDIAELTAGHEATDPRRPFKPRWLTRGRFELVGVVNRIDRRRFDPSGCGEVRLVYRLALRNRGRPTTRLPLTVNVRIPQPKPAKETDCRTVAARWMSREDVTTLVDDLPPLAQMEVNFQSIHAPGALRDMDDSASYVLRSFEVVGESIRVDGLFNTPRSDLGKEDLLPWIAAHLREIDDGSAVLPKAFLATRVTSISPRGLLSSSNRPFSRIISTADVATLPLSSLVLARTPDLLLRRLEEMTCAGCHQSHGVAGFHLLGEERSLASFNTLAVGHSPHLGADLTWRTGDLASAARGDLGPPRPYAAYPNGEMGSDCGLTDGLSSWSCKPGLVCRDIHHGDVGTCTSPSGGAPGSPCEDVSLVPSDRAEGPVVTARSPDVTCPAPVGDQLEGPFCAPNWLGFTGGMCSERCSRIGDRRGSAICAPLPATGYEADCFLSREPIESCLTRHFVTAYVASCDAHTPCRADYGCSRVPNAPPTIGACVPPYFIFQARVDGPLLDR
jgi:hypothetical protein